MSDVKLIAEPFVGFGTSFWRNMIIIGVLAYGLDRYVSAPESQSNGEGTITRYIRNNLMVPIEQWTRVNEIHTIMSENTAKGKLLSQAAERPSIHRHRFPRFVLYANVHD